MVGTPSFVRNPVHNSPLKQKIKLLCYMAYWDRFTIFYSEIMHIRRSSQIPALQFLFGVSDTNEIHLTNTLGFILQHRSLYLHTIIS